MADPPADPDTKQRKNAAQQAPARRPGLRAVAATLPKVTRRALGKHGFAEGGLATEWPSIVGEHIAARCLPRKLALARPGKRAEGALTLRVEPGFATDLQHLSPLLIERINGYFGYRAIAKLTLHQGPIRSPRKPPPAPARPLSAEQEAALSKRLERVEDEELREAMERLGRAMQEKTGLVSTEK